jgi:MurNAc alpha-1-phosphate uridylyltransferase
MKAMILAAGYGKRLKPITDSIPKPLIKIKGRSLLDYHLTALRNAGIKEVIINISHLGHKIKAEIGDGERFGVQIIYSEELTPLETGGGIVQALPYLGQEPFLVVNGDIWTDYPFSQLKPPLNGLGYIVLVDNPAHNPEGDFYFSEGKLQEHGKQKYTFSGIGVYHPQLFTNYQPEPFRLAPLLRKMIPEGLIGAQYYSGQWCDIGTLPTLARLNGCTVEELLEEK